MSVLSTPRGTRIGQGTQSGRWIRRGNRIVVLPQNTDLEAGADDAALEGEFGRRRTLPRRGGFGRRPLRKPGLRKPRPRPPRRRRPRWWRGSVRGPTVVLADTTAQDAPEEGSERVRWVQSTLNRILDLHLPVDGIMTPETRRAIRVFQRRRGLPEDGIVGPETERALIAARAGRARRGETLADREYDDEFGEPAQYDREIVPPTDSRARITNTKRIPFQWICTVIPTFRHPTTGKPIEMTTQPGTGFLIGPRHVLTAAHVLFPTDGPLQNQSPSSVKVTPGHDGGARPHGQYVSGTYGVRSEWRSGGKNTFNPSYDFAMIVLPASIDRQRLKCWGEAGTNTFRFPISKDWLKGKVVNVCGYPRDKTQYTQWIAYDVLDDPAPTRNGTAVPNLFKYKADSCLGQSGAPVWFWDGKSKRYLVGIHTGFCDFLDGCSRQSGTGCLPGSSRWSHNSGVLFNHEVQAQINAWLK